jgi:hypothetical protein
MRIIYERSGGFMGLKSSLTIDLDELPLDQAEALRTLLGEANLISLSEDPPARSIPDGFQYSLTIESEEVKHTVFTSDVTMPASLRPLIDELSQLARMRRH